MKQIDVGKFYCTDSGCYQYCKKISPMEYQFTQIEWLDTTGKDKQYCVTASSIIDVSKMDIDDIELAICGFYKSIEEMVEDYGKDFKVSSYASLIAKCSFENETDDNSISDAMSLEDCIKFQHDWMLKNS